MFVRDTVGSQNFDFFSSDAARDDINELFITLERMGDRAIADEICSGTIDAAAPIVLEEEKRLLQQVPNYPNFPKLNVSWLTIRKFRNRNLRWIAQVGYESDILEEHIEPLIVEFGRGRGRRAKKTIEINEQINKKGNRIMQEQSESVFKKEVSRVLREKGFTVSKGNDCITVISDGKEIAGIYDNGMMSAPDGASDDAYFEVKKIASTSANTAPPTKMPRR